MGYGPREALRLLNGIRDHVFRSQYGRHEKAPASCPAGA